MKHVIALAAALFSFSAFSYNKANTCLEKLTYDYSVDSRAFKINTDSVDITTDDGDHLGKAIAIIKALARRHGCNPNHEMNFSKSPFGTSNSYCRRVSRNREYSMSCYVESNIGFFFVTEDLQTNAFVVFSRWD